MPGPTSIEQRLRALGRKAGRLQGPDAAEWWMNVEAPTPDFLSKHLPVGSVVFANNGFGDYLFLVPSVGPVQVYWHEGAVIEAYCENLEDLSASKRRAPTNHPPVRYYGTDQEVRIGDLVSVKFWLFRKCVGRITYVPGVSDLKRELERDGLAWIRMKAEDGTVIDSVVVDGSLGRGVQLLARSGASEQATGAT